MAFEESQGNRKGRFPFSKQDRGPSPTPNAESKIFFALLAIPTLPRPAVRDRCCSCQVLGVFGAWGEVDPVWRKRLKFEGVGGTYFVSVYPFMGLGGLC